MKQERKCCPSGGLIAVWLMSLPWVSGSLTAQNHVSSCWHGGAEFEAMARAVPAYVTRLDSGEQWNLAAWFMSSGAGNGAPLWSVRTEIALPIGTVDVLYGTTFAWVTKDQCWNVGFSHAFGPQWTARLAGGIGRFVCPGVSPFVVGMVQAGGYCRPAAHCLCFVEGGNLSLSRCRGLDFAAEYAAGVVYEVSDSFILAGRLSKQSQCPMFLHTGMKELWSLSDKWRLALMTGLRYPYIRPSIGFQLGYGSWEGIFCSVWDTHLGPAFGMSLTCSI